MADAPSRRTFTDIMLGVSGRPLVDPSAFEEHNRLSNETIRSATMKVKGVLLFTRISCVLLPMDGSILYAFPPWDLIHRVLGTRTEGNRRRDDSDSTLLTLRSHLLSMLADLPVQRPTRGFSARGEGQSGTGTFPVGISLCGNYQETLTDSWSLSRGR